MDQTTVDGRMEAAILRKLYEHPGREAILVPQMFSPPMMLSNIFRLSCQLKKKGMTSGPDRRLGGWHMKLLEPGVAYCQNNGGR